MRLAWVDIVDFYDRCASGCDVSVSMLLNVVYYKGCWAFFQYSGFVLLMLFHTRFTYLLLILLFLLLLLCLFGEVYTQ